MKRCPKCFQKIEDSVIICPECGYDYIDRRGKKKLGFPAAISATIAAGSFGFCIGYIFVNLMSAQEITLVNLLGIPYIPLAVLSLGVLASIFAIVFSLILGEEFKTKIMSIVLLVLNTIMLIFPILVASGMLN